MRNGMAPQSIPENPGFELVAVPRRRGLKQATRGARIAGMRLWTSVRNWFRSAAMEHGVDVGDFLIEAAAVGKGFVGWGRVRRAGERFLSPLAPVTRTRFATDAQGLLLPNPPGSPVWFAVFENRLGRLPPWWPAS